MRGSFPIDAVDAAYRSYLAQETFVWLEGGQKNSAAENALLELFAAQSLVVASVVDPPFRARADRIHLWMYSFPHRERR